MTFNLTLLLFLADRYIIYAFSVYVCVFCT